MCIRDSYTGNVGLGEGRFEVVPEKKLDTEVDISRSPRAIWDGVEFALLQALLGALYTYAAANPGLKTPLQWRDEGFRLKRYTRHAAGGALPQHHVWHADSGNDEDTACRAVAVLFYFNDVTTCLLYTSPSPRDS